MKDEMCGHGSKHKKDNRSEINVCKHADVQGEIHQVCTRIVKSKIIFANMLSKKKKKKEKKYMNSAQLQFKINKQLEHFISNYCLSVFQYFQLYYKTGDSPIFV